MHELISVYQETVADAVKRYGGYVAKFLGDGVLAYFGWPIAYEDQAERAIRAGLAAIAGVEGLKTPPARGSNRASASRAAAWSSAILPEAASSTVVRSRAKRLTSLRAYRAPPSRGRS